MGKETRKQTMHQVVSSDDYDAFVPLSELNLSNGFLFGEVMQDEDTCRTVLEIILRHPIGRVVYVNKEQQVEAGTQYHKYKGVRLDVYFQGDDSTCYCVEMQTKNRYNLPKRSRHYQGVMDVQMLTAGEINYNKLSDSIIIFICTFDLFGEGHYCYTFENTCKEQPGLTLSDGVVKIFLNTEGKLETEENRLLVEFLRYVVDKDAPVHSPEVKRIKRRVEEVKRNQETEARYMTSLTYIREVYEDGREAGEENGLIKGRVEGKVQDILDLLSELGDIPESLGEKVSMERSLETLGRWVRVAARAKSVADFEKKMYEC